MKRGWWLAGAVLLPRLLLFPFNENLGGDAIARTWLAHRWLESPHFIFGFDGGAKQFGPLHIYLLALAEWLWPSLLHAGRVVSLIVGVLTAWPLFIATRRWFGEQAATFAVLGFAFWGVHVQCSTTSSSEALNLLLVMTAVTTSRLGGGSGLGSALALSLACATRFDSWLLVPLLALAEWRQLGWRSALKFTAFASALPVVMLIGDWVGRGDPFFSIRYIDAFHRAWWPGEAATWGEGWYRVMCALWWPGVAAVTMTPFIAVAGIVGAARAWRTRPELRWLVWLLVVPVVLYAVRGAVFASFAPLARFTLKELLLLFPLAGWVLASSRWRGVVIALLVTWCAGLAALTWAPDSPWPSSLRAVSAASRLESRLRAPASWLRDNATAGDFVVDVDPRGYDDLTLSYFSGLPYERQHRRRYEYYWQTRPDEAPRWLVLFDGGSMERDGEVERLSPSRVRHRLHDYERRAFDIFERVD